MREVAFKVLEAPHKIQALTISTVHKEAVLRYKVEVAVDALLIEPAQHELPKTAELPQFSVEPFFGDYMSTSGLQVSVSAVQAVPGVPHECEFKEVGEFGLGKSELVLTNTHVMPTVVTKETLSDGDSRALWNMNEDAPMLDVTLERMFTALHGMLSQPLVLRIVVGTKRAKDGGAHPIRKGGVDEARCNALSDARELISSDTTPVWCHAHHS